MNRVLLPNGNTFTKPTVSPNNWNKSGATVKKPWRIRIRYFDSDHPQGKQFSYRDMNLYHDLKGRQESTRAQLSFLLKRLKQDLWNPITRQQPVKEGAFEVDPSTPVNDALQFAYERKVCSPKTKIQLRQALAQIKKAFHQLGHSGLSISEVRRKHVRFVLDQIGRNKGGWSSPTNFNNFRSSLKMLFDVLDEVEAIEVDPVSKIRKMQIVHKIRETLSLNERKVVIEHLKSKHPAFHRFVQIFFHSGARVSELLRLKGCDLDLAGQRFKVSIIKGKRRLQVWKTIKDIAMPYWEELHPAQDEFIFSKHLAPGELPINPLQITRRWRIQVKAKPSKDGRSGGIGITADLYSLKHSHSTEVVEALSTQEAADHNSHTNDAMVAKVYDIRRFDRQHDRVKKLNNPL